MSIYKISNPYKSVEGLIGNKENHYKTNLHTHSTYSDANEDMVTMINAFYDLDFDILAFAEHGLLGKPWDQEPTLVPLYQFQNLWHGKRRHITTEQYKEILDGTYKTPAGKRTKQRGMNSVTNAIEANMLTLVKNHVNGYFTDDRTENICGKENDFETPVRKIHESGGLSHINHPTDWLQAIKYPDCADKEENIAFFADILRKYPSCLGIEVLNLYDIVNYCDRILWDNLLKRLIPEGKRSVWGFGNSDAHETKHADEAFMDFVLPEYNEEIFRKAMETGTFFAVARHAKLELGEDFRAEGDVPVVTKINVDDENDTITVKAESCTSIQWIADGKIIKSDDVEVQGEITSIINLADFKDDISCYVRFQVKGKGGILMAQPFTLDDGDMQRFVVKSPAPLPKTRKEKLKKKFIDTRLGVVVDRFILGH
ncbi:MAG: hypothetical protein E7533_02785 [Ruminococcaceae bacterium]|nr:hypothetical protein [Oscillospiraceae bacterium]